MKIKLVFFNTGWMDSYCGLKNDSLTGGGKSVKEMGWGHELYNFKPVKRKVFGYVQPKIDRTYDNRDTIKIEKLGASKSDESVSNITVVWTARDPDTGGTYIVGWYKNATVYRYLQQPPNSVNRKYKNESIGFFTTASEYKLLDRDERNVRVLRQKKNWMGQSNVWYAENNPSFVKSIEDYIFKGIKPKQPMDKKKGRGGFWQSDPFKRSKIEKEAVNQVTKYYTNLGYMVDSVEKDNVGWDLNATNNKTSLKLEVKGLSGTAIFTELTSNEFTNLNNDKNFYRICIVTDTLLNPTLTIFAYSKENNAWKSSSGKILKFTKVISARISV